MKENIDEINTEEINIGENKKPLEDKSVNKKEKLLSLSNIINDEEIAENDKIEEENNNIMGRSLFSIDSMIDKNKYIALYNFKDFLLMLGLLVTSSFNFNFLYIPFLLSGILYSLLIYSNNSSQKKFKSIFNIIILIYSGLNLIFEITIIIMCSTQSDIIKNNKNLFINLGVPYLLTEKVFDLIKTIFGPILMIIICIISIIFEKKCFFLDKDLEKKKKKDLTDMDTFYKKVIKYLFISFFVITAFATFNKSILTIFYLFLFYIIFFLFLCFSSEMVYILYKSILLIEIIVIVLHLAIINITNIYLIADTYFNINKESLFYDFLANNWSKFGFYFSYYKDDNYSTVFIDWIGYFFGSISFVSLVFIIKDISNDIYEKIKIKEQEAKSNILNKNKEKNKYAKSFFKKLNEKIINFFSGEFVMLNIIKILAIIWLYYLRNYFSIVVFIWVFSSFLYLDPSPIRLLSKFLLLPAINISLLFIASSRIFYSYYDDFDDVNKIKSLHFALGNYDYDLINFFAMNLFYIIIICFIYFVPKNNNLKIKVNEKEIKTNIINNDKDENNEIVLKYLIIDDISLKKAEELTILNIIKKFIFNHINKITLALYSCCSFHASNIKAFISRQNSFIYYYIIPNIIPSSIFNGFIKGLLP